VRSSLGELQVSKRPSFWGLESFQSFDQGNRLLRQGCQPRPRQARGTEPSFIRRVCFYPSRYAANVTFKLELPVSMLIAQGRAPEALLPACNPAAGSLPAGVTKNMPWGSRVHAAIRSQNFVNRRTLFRSIVKPRLWNMQAMPSAAAQERNAGCLVAWLPWEESCRGRRQSPRQQPDLASLGAPRRPKSRRKWGHLHCDCHLNLEYPRYCGTHATYLAFACSGPAQLGPTVSRVIHAAYMGTA
jgi:hypothetical protein